MLRSRTLSPAVAGALLLQGLLWPVSCSRSGFGYQAAGDHCRTSGDCTAGAVCHQGRCRLACDSSDDCAEGEVCADGLCLTARPVDAAAADRGVADARIADAAASSDAAIPDAASSDAAIPDAAIADATSFDAIVADTAFFDAGREDAGPVPICMSSTLRVADVFGDSSELVTYTFDHGYKSLRQETDLYATSDAQHLGGVSLGQGLFMGAADFGTNGALGIDALPLPLEAAPRSFSFWFSLQPSTQARAFLTYGDQAGPHGAFFSIMTTASRELAVDIGHETFSSGVVVATDRWYHLAVSYDGSDLALYLDGQYASGASLALATSGTHSHGQRLGDFDGAHSLLARLDQLRIFNRGLSTDEASSLAGECMYADPLVDVDFSNLVYSEDFFTDLSAWNVWGSPTPQIIHDDDASDGSAFDCNGDLNYHSGIDSLFSLAHDQSFTVEYRAKQPQDTSTSNKWLYIDLGVTHTQSSGNGTTSPVHARVAGVRDPNHWELFNPFGLDFYVAGNENVYWDYWNDFAYHVYRLEHRKIADVSYFRLLVDGVLYDLLRRTETSTDPWYITIQGRSYGSVNNTVDWVRVYTP
ncbi:MAG: hypothetical protein JXR83_00385 [Deltaproteobacteria bacterium]|nr:hypothetical protein [Deltaproteobacteria bacterium]